jgi:hypothetical protein
MAINLNNPNPHPMLQDSSGHMFPATVTIKQMVSDPTSNDENNATWETVTATIKGVPVKLENINCRRVPVGRGGGAGIFQVYGPGATHEILLQGYYEPGIRPDMRAIVTQNGVQTWHIVLGASSDGSNIMTKLIAQQLP